MKSPKILIVYYSMYGHIYEMARQVKEGIEAAGGTVVLKRVAELVPEQFLDPYARQAAQAQKDIEVADPRADLQGIDGVIVGTPTRFGNMASQMKNFWDQTGGDWMKGTLVGKPGGVFTSTATQHGGQESTILATHTVLLHHGCVIVGLPGAVAPALGTLDALQGGSPYGPGTIAGGRGERLPSEIEKTMARDFGAHFSKIASRLQS
ncbi:MAG: NAD(P)H:quinone oxidoreductase [Deltaproteobacteria bacterium HGW-Deltaproteobacteria-22]|jgi:NAD(P)H dehydrogenase (quinone)|nr:MAG: NAD(P)H:quinone oxidoreductase [Deltaproteobacteria bacterium HGW-Deltaproteobacteria-22]